MSAITISDVQADEVLDSRGVPTLRIELTSATGQITTSEVPAGTSTGRFEARELRDGDPSRYAGLGVLRAIDGVNEEIRTLLVADSWTSLGEIDRAMVDLDGTSNLARLGANAVAGVSLAAARLFAAVSGNPLWAWLTDEAVTPRLPVPSFNVLNGGLHARNSMEFQEFMIAPLGAASMDEAIRCGAEVYSALRNLLVDEGHSTALGDEGGFAPEIFQPVDALLMLLRAIEAAGYPAGLDGVAIAIDPAASRLRRPDGSYTVGEHRYTSHEMVQFYVDLVRDFPIWSIEDAMSEDDHDGWRLITEELGGRIQLVGDDLFATDPTRIAEGAAAGRANAALIKPNQVGTLTQTQQAIRVCREHGYSSMVSHRSGETSDDFIADLAVASGCGQIKAGAPARGERVSKYNRLLAISRRHPEIEYGLDTSSLNRIGRNRAPT